MHHDSRLEFCEVCKNRGFSSKSGVICILTNDKPDFVDDCEDFIEDHKAIVSKVREEEDRTDKQFEPSERFAKSMHGMQGVGKDERIVLGIFNILVALIWFGIGYFYFGKVYYVPMLVFAFGLFKLIDGIIKRRKESEIQALLDEQMKEEID